MRELAEAYWQISSLRQQAPNVLERAIDAGRSPYGSRPPWCLRAAHMRFELNERAAALALCERLLKEYVHDASCRGIPSSTDDLPAYLFLITAMAEKYKAAKELADTVQNALRGDFYWPPARTLLRLAERRLRAAAGERLHPAIALAVQPSGGDRLKFIWQLNYELLPIPPDEPEIESLLVPDYPRSRLVMVPFVGAQDAVPPEGYHVRLEAGPDWRSFKPVATVPAAGERSIAGANVAERIAVPGRAQWYRAVLLKNGEEVATSPAVTGVAGKNMLAASWLTTAGLTGADAPKGFRSSTWSMGGPQIGEQDVPGVGPVGALRGELERPSKLETVPAVQVDTERRHVLSAWVEFDPRLMAARVPAGRWSHVWSRHDMKPAIHIEFLGPHDAPLNSLPLTFWSEARFIFGQLFIDYSYDDPVDTYSQTSDWRRDFTPALLKDAESLRLTLEVGRLAALSQLCLVTAKGAQE